MRSQSVEQDNNRLSSHEPQDSRRAQTDVPDDFNPDVPSISDFKLQGSLGKGSFGDVTLAIEKSTGNQVAVKELHIPDILKRDKKEAVIREGRILETLRGRPFIITLFNKFKEDSSLYFVFEHCKHGTLSSLI
jgi:protein kinase A